MKLRILWLSISALALAGGAEAQDVWTTPHPGVRLLERPEGQLRLAEIDLCQAGIRVRATRPSERTSTTTSFAEDINAIVAINGDFYRAGGLPVGLAAGNGERWEGTSDTGRHGGIAFGEGRASVFSVIEVTNYESWMREIIGGVPEVVEGGAPILEYSSASSRVQDVRSAAGLSEDGRTLYLATVGGPVPGGEIGVRYAELGQILHELGAYHALNLDGGGSTSLYVAGRGLVNTPVDGAERVVRNHLGITFGTGDGTSACPGESVGQICDIVVGAETEIDETSERCFFHSGPSMFDAEEHQYTYAVDCGDDTWRSCDASDTRGRWYFNIAESGRYAVEAFVPSTVATGGRYSSSAPYVLQSAEGQRTARIDLDSSRGEWAAIIEDVSLGAQDDVSLDLHDSTGEAFMGTNDQSRIVVFDRIRVRRLDGEMPRADAGVPDGGPSFDGGSQYDAGPRDVGVDAAFRDAGASEDGGPVDPGFREDPAPPGCSLGARSSPTLWIWILIFGALRRRWRDGSMT